MRVPLQQKRPGVKRRRFFFVSVCFDGVAFLPFADVPLVSTLVSAPYSGCMDVRVNGQPVDLDRAVHKHNDIRSHSCPLLDSLQ